MCFYVRVFFLLWLFVRCNISFECFLTLKFFFQLFDQYSWFACEKTYFPTKWNNKWEMPTEWRLCPSPAALVESWRGRKWNKEMKCAETKGFLLLMCWVLSPALGVGTHLILTETNVVVGVVLVVGGCRSPLPPSGELQWRGLMCHWQRATQEAEDDVSLCLSSAVRLRASLWQLPGWQLNFRPSWGNTSGCESKSN